MVKRNRLDKVHVVKAPVGPRKAGEVWRKYTDTSERGIVVRRDQSNTKRKESKCLVSRIYSWGSH